MTRKCGWVADRFESDTRTFAQASDIAEFLGVERSTVIDIGRRIGIERRPRSVGATRTAYEPFTDAEAKRIVAEYYRRRGQAR